MAYWFPQSWEDLDLEASYIVAVRDTAGNMLALIDDYDVLDYTKRINNQGILELTASVEQVDPDNFGLDYLIEVWRAAPEMSWAEDLVALQRLDAFRFDDADKEWFNVVGAGLENLLRRRHIMPATGEAFVEVTDNFTDIMRYLVNSQCGPIALAARQFPGLTVEADSHEGGELELVYRFTNLFDELEILTGLGADFEVAHTANAEFQFRVHYPWRGLDKRVGNTEGNAPVIFSIEMANMQGPSVEDNRVDEVTVVYVAGRGIGADREIVERLSLYDAQNDSPWNRIENFLEARRELTTASLMALGDGHLADTRQTISFTCLAIPTPACLYGVDWDLGDMVTGYYRSVEYDMRVMEVHVTVDTDGEHIEPTFEIFDWRDVSEGPYFT